MAGTYIPAVPSQYLDNNGDPADSFQLFTYESGGTTKLATYSDQALSSANANPIVLDSAGRATIFLIENDSYKFVLAPAADTDPPASAIWTRDNITSIPNTMNTDIMGDYGAAAATAGQVVYLNSSGIWDQADADLIGRAGQAYAIGIALESTGGGDFTKLIRVAGRLTGLTGLSPGSLYYISTNAGELTATKPVTAVGARVVGVADTATSLILTPSIPFYDVTLNLKSVGFSVGQGNVSTSETTLTSYSTTLLANLLSEAGHCLVIEGTFSLAANTNAKSANIKVGGASSVEIFTTSANLANHIVPFRALIRYRTSTTGGLISHSYIDAATAGNPTTYMVNAAITGADWTANQTLAITATSGTATDDVTLTDYNVSLIQGPGSLV